MKSRFPITDQGYLVLGPLSRQLFEEVERLKKEGRNNQIIIDIGCGIKPYQGHFAALARVYWGVDIETKFKIDVLAGIETLPFRNASADIVLCTQVLEHSRYPQRVLSEIQRVLKPGGITFISTHGVYIYHPCPSDCWRWTHEGLKVVLEEAGLEAVRILPNGGPLSCLFYNAISLIAFLSYKSKLLTPLRWLFIPLLNFIGEKLDILFFDLMFPKSKLLLVANYLAVAKKPLDRK